MIFLSPRAFCLFFDTVFKKIKLIFSFEVLYNPSNIWLLILFSKNLQRFSRKRASYRKLVQSSEYQLWARRSIMRWSELQWYSQSLPLLMLWQVITSGGITFRDQLWHKECFLCSGCRKELCEEAFMSRDDFPFCLDCYNHLYAKKCAACTKPITGKCFILPWFYHDAIETMENAT